jgi:hypothetical protein
MEIQKAYYAVIPATVRYDKNLLPNAKLLYGEITALCSERGYCFASNAYFAELYSVDVRNIKRWIAQLCEYKYITSKIIYKENSKEVAERRLYLPDALSAHITEINPVAKTSRGVGTKTSPGGDKNVPDNNTDEYINKNNIKRFIKPTVEEVRAYCVERNNGIDAEYFVDYYESKGWVVGKTPMKDWKCAVRTFERNKKTFGPAKSGSGFVRPTNDAFVGKKGGILE